MFLFVDVSGYCSEPGSSLDQSSIDSACGALSYLAECLQAPITLLGAMSPSPSPSRQQDIKLIHPSSKGKGEAGPSFPTTPPHS